MTILMAFAWFCLPVSSYAKGDGKIVKEANQLYNKGDYDEALKEYDEAESALPDSEIVKFGKGAVLYKKREYDKASESFLKALVAKEPGLEAKANYNIGNSKYKAGRMMGADKQGTVIRIYKEALDYYKRAMELDQKDEDAKFNYEFVQKELKALEEKQKKKVEQKQEQQQQQNQQQQQGQEKQQQQQQEQQKAPSYAEPKKDESEASEGKQEEQAQEKKAQEDKEKEEKAAQTGAQKKEQEAGQEEKEEAQPAGEEEKAGMSAQEAKMLLDAYGQQEEPKVELRKHRVEQEVQKDW